MNTENTQNPSNGIDQDDVEAHGLKEVAIGIGAAAVISGGGAGVALAASGSPAPTHGHVATVVQHLEQGAADTISRHAPQGPPTGSPNTSVLPTKPHLPSVSIPNHRIVPAAGANDAGVSNPVDVAKNRVKKTTTTVKKDATAVKDLVGKSITPPTQVAPPAER